MPITPYIATDYLRKLSSTATPPGGRSVAPMDDLIERELSGRILDESPGLISRLFPTLSLPVRGTLINRLNTSHNKLQRSASQREHKLRTTTRTLRPRPQKTSSTTRGTREKKGNTRKGVKRRGGEKVKREVEYSEESNTDQDDPGAVLYDTKKKKWNLEADGATVNEAVIDGIERVIDEHFAFPKPPPLFNDIKAVDPPLDELVPAVGPVVPLSPARSSQQINTDVEEPESSCDGSFDGANRRGAAVDGDSSSDQDYVEGKKSGGPAKPHTTESHRAAFMNALAAALLLCDGIDPSSISGSKSAGSQSTSDNGSGLSKPRLRRWWYGTFSTKELLSDDGESHWKRKPDLVLIEGALDDYHDAITWKSPKAIGEITQSTLQNNRTLLKSLNTKAYILLSSQPWRRFVVALSFAASELRVHQFDRSGAQISAPIDFHKRVEETCQIIYAIAHGDKHILGFDPTLHLNFYSSISRRQQLPPFIGIVEVDGVKYDIISILWASNGFVGRGTLCLHVRLHGAPPRRADEALDEYDFVLKDSWVEESLVEHEPSILEHIAGLEGVPSLVKAWTVQYNGKDDNTSRYRPAGWTPRKGCRFVPRVHRRLLMNPVGSPLSTFRSQKELLHGLIQGLEIHEMLVTQKRVLHRDISPNNLIYRRDSGAIRKSMIIDFDYAIHLGQQVQYPNGTGTLPFASLDILRQVSSLKLGQTGVRHTVSDDLESFFYVFVWICVLFTGPNGAVQSPPEFKTEDESIIHTWGERALAPGGLAGLKRDKDSFLHGTTGNDLIDKQFTPYFSNLKRLAYEWKELSSMEDLRRTKPMSLNARPLTHQTVIDLLRRYCDPLPISEPKVFPLPPLDLRIPSPEPPPQMPSSLAFIAPKALLASSTLPVSSSTPTPSKRSPINPSTAATKRPPPSPSSSVNVLSKRRRNNSFGSIGTAWLPIRQ